MKKRAKSIDEIFDKGRLLDSAVRRAVREARLQNSALERVRKAKPKRKSAPTGRLRSRAA